MLPGCSANNTNGSSILISNEMLQAYVMMRGPSGGLGMDPDDPLLDWILGLDSQKKQEGKSNHDVNQDMKR